MVGTTAALIGTAALGAGGSLINTGVNAYEAYKDRQFNAQQAQLQRDFEERMSNTQYQRTVADMEAAGINPASLSSMQPTSGGVPASAASSSAHGVGQVDFSDFSNVLSKAYDTVFRENDEARKDLYANIKANALEAAIDKTNVLSEHYKAQDEYYKGKNKLYKEHLKNEAEKLKLQGDKDAYLKDYYLYLNRMHHNKAYLDREKTFYYQKKNK